jgi:hypothetical protein
VLAACGKKLKKGKMEKKKKKNTPKNKKKTIFFPKENFEELEKKIKIKNNKK